MNFLLKDYAFQKRTFKDGFKDLKESNKAIFQNYKFFLSFLLLFIGLSILKNIVFTNAPLNLDYQTTNSLILQGESNYFMKFGFYFISFLFFFYLPIFTIRRLYNRSERMKDSLIFGFEKLLDIKLYVFSFLALLSFLISFKIASYPVFSHIPSLNAQIILDFIKDINQTIMIHQNSNVDSLNAAISDLIQNKKEYHLIYEGLITLSIPTFFCYFIAASLFFITSFFIVFFGILSCIMNPFLTFIESIKVSILINIKNTLYITSLFSLLIVISLILNQFTFNNLIVSSIISGSLFLYSLYIFSYAISRSIIELNNK